VSSHKELNAQFEELRRPTKEGILRTSHNPSKKGGSGEKKKGLRPAREKKTSTRKRSFASPERETAKAAPDEERGGKASQKREEIRDEMTWHNREDSPEPIREKKGKDLRGKTRET